MITGWQNHSDHLFPGRRLPGTGRHGRSCRRSRAAQRVVKRLIRLQRHPGCLSGSPQSSRLHSGFRSGGCGRPALSWKLVRGDLRRLPFTFLPRQLERTGIERAGDDSPGAGHFFALEPDSLPLGVLALRRCTGAWSGSSVCRRHQLTICLMPLHLFSRLPF
jgi:hypothetical protein